MDQIQVLQSRASRLLDKLTALDDRIQHGELPTKEWLETVHQRRLISYDLQQAKRKIMLLEMGKPIYGSNGLTFNAIYSQRYWT